MTSFLTGLCAGIIASIVVTTIGLPIWMNVIIIFSTIFITRSFYDAINRK